MPIQTQYVKFTGKIDRRKPRDEGTDVWMRENWLCRDDILKRPSGTERAITTTLTGIPTWEGRYFTIETGSTSPKTFIYTQDGNLWVQDDLLNTASVVKTGLNLNAYPKHWIFKSGNQNFMYLVDGLNLYKYDGNNDNRFDLVTVTDSDGNPVKPIDVIEHRDRLLLISEAFLFISANLDPDNFSSATDSIQLIVGSGKGRNMALGKIQNTLFIFNTEGIFNLSGDVISAVASTFEVRLAYNKNIIAGRTAKKVENAIMFLADDFNVWTFNGSNATKISHQEKLEDFINTYRDKLDKAVATYYNNYYMLSFVEKGQIYNNLEFWWDALEDKADFVRGRNVASYLEVDPTIEQKYMQMGRSDVGYTMWADHGYNFDKVAIESRLWTRDITPAKGTNVRFYAFMPEYQPTSSRSIEIKYNLDGRLTDPTNNSSWQQALQGDVIQIGTPGIGIQIANQSQTMDRARPKINYSRGQSISFYIKDATLDLACEFIGMSIQYIGKAPKKSKTIGA